MKSAGGALMVVGVVVGFFHTYVGGALILIGLVMIVKSAY
jgi:hypothetical protein